MTQGSFILSKNNGRIRNGSEHIVIICKAQICIVMANSSTILSCIDFRVTIYEYHQINDHTTLTYSQLKEESKMSNSNLPPELIADILPRLPVKSLTRFKGVSKSWATRISDPDFVKTHLHRAQFRRILLSSANSLYSIDHETDDLAAAVDLHYPRDQIQNPKPQSHAVQIIGSCNGLVCIMPQPDNPPVHPITLRFNRVWRPVCCHWLRVRLRALH
ncbi:hypothetical protein SO802_014851 [Lithocarpus litseifolius]|uniref:F-box domain-containing protein n=1 Tax=Lithocarpus litseifolius TaxID=425828 RepID=A0AAW2CVC1_9ROSI